jgi:hypothetical protein
MLKSAQDSVQRPIAGGALCRRPSSATTRRNTMVLGLYGAGGFALHRLWRLIADSNTIIPQTANFDFGGPCYWIGDR